MKSYLLRIVLPVLLFVALLTPLSGGEAQAPEWRPAWASLSDSGLIHISGLEAGAAIKPEVPPLTGPPDLKGRLPPGCWRRLTASSPHLTSLPMHLQAQMKTGQRFSAMTSKALFPAIGMYLTMTAPQMVSISGRKATAARIPAATAPGWWGAVRMAASWPAAATIRIMPNPG